MRPFASILLPGILLFAVALVAPAHADEQLVPLPGQPPKIAWPTQSWPTASTPAVLEQILDRTITGTAPGTPQNTRAILVVKGGQLIAERYGEGFDANTRLQSWSMAKSVVHALVGILIKDGQIDLYQPARVARWNRKVNDSRKAITVENLLRMESGLTFSEDYTNPETSNVLQMLFGKGRLDTAEYAAGGLLQADPGTLWQYSSGTSNVLSGVIRDTIGAKSAEEYRAFMEESLFSRIGIRSAVPEFDEANTFIGSSYLHMTGRDWARFGLLYLRDGVWDGKRILPEHWADHARLPTPNSKGQYGAHFWLNGTDPETGQAVITDEIPTDTFMARGFGAQVVVIIPSLDMVVVYMGLTYDDAGPVVQAITDIINAAI
ncbi:MAG: beta-lactamase family protein [Rhodobiaceae bacterium]|nr:beta-lactamase family protein [Rhodobiaceae bacterium]